MSSPRTSATTTTRASAAGMIAVAAAAAFLATFNETFLNVALTPIMLDFSIDVGTVQWLTTGYLLLAAVFVPVSNVFYQRYPTRPLFVGVVAFLVVGSIVAALAPNFWALLIGRLVQAIGTGLLTPIGMNVTLAVAPREKLGAVMGLMGAMTTLGPSLAIVLSGVLLQFAPWRVLLWVFGVLSLLVLLAGAVCLRTTANLRQVRLDTLSLCLVALGLLGLLYGISTLFTGPFVPTLVGLAIGVVFLALFVIRQRRVDNPLINLRPLTNTPFVLGVSVTILGLLFVFAMNVVIPIFLQSAKGLAPLEASLALAPGILLTVVLGPIAGKLFDRHGGRVSIPAGLTVTTACILLVGLAAGAQSVLLFAALYVPAVLATAFVIGPSQTFALASLDRETSPHGVTIVSTSFQIAGCLGTSLGVGVYSAGVATAAGSGLGSLDSATVGFRAAAVLVALTSLIGLACSLAAPRAARAAAARRAETRETEAERASGTPTVGGLMNTDVFTLAPEATVLDALRTFAEHGISGAPIVDNERHAIGFLSDGDVLRYLSSAHPSSRSFWTFASAEADDLGDVFDDLADMPAMRLATREVQSLQASDSLADAVALLSDTRLKKVPVLDAESAQVVGVLSRSTLRRFTVSAVMSRAS